MKNIGMVGALILLFASLGNAATGMISGTVKGPDGVPFRAAFVRAENVQNKMTTMVLSDNKGYYWAELAPGTYTVWATSVGYKSDPARRPDVKVEEAQTVLLNFTMQKGMVQWDQLTKYQSGVLLPDGKGKDTVLTECYNCHGMGKISSVGRRDYDGWLQAIGVMRELQVANIKPAVADVVAGYLSTVLGPDSSTPQSPAQLPEYQKVKMEHDYWSDDSLNIMYVDYPLAGDVRDRPGVAHVDKDGNAWFEMAGGVGRLNPTTAEVKVWRLNDPSTKPGYRNIHEALPLKDGSAVWITVHDPNKLARLDLKTEKWEVYSDEYNGPRVAQMEANSPWPRLKTLPGGQNGAARRHTLIADQQGNIWTTGRPLAKFDIETKKFIDFPDVPDTYGIRLDQQGNVWAAEFNSHDHHSLVKIDSKTNKVTKYKLPDPNSRPRRVKIDSKGYVWVADYAMGRATRFDPKTETFKEFQLPGPMPTPYGFEVDHNDNVWYASMYTDVMGMLDPKTGKVTEYASPYGEKGSRDMDEDSQGRIWYGAQPNAKVGYFRVRSESEKALAQKR